VPKALAEGDILGQGARTAIGPAAGAVMSAAAKVAKVARTANMDFVKLRIAAPAS